VQILGEGTARRMDFWGASKSFPSTLLVGTTMLVSDSVPDLELSLSVNGHTRQHARSSEIIYSASELRRFADPLDEGDLVLTGTPAGVALSVPRWKRLVADALLDRWRKLGAAIRTARKSQRFLSAGNVIEMEGGPLGKVRAVVDSERP
jgi:2-keto-4-pentenoate hydratase/2-oxohepta-3-ene-1,7-dioic acid hydratase in catechol pathway